MLKKLRGEYIDWAALARQMQLRKTCHNCEESRGKEDYSGAEWKTRGEGCCKACIRGKEEAGTPHLCSRCDEWKADEQYKEHQRMRQRRRVCEDCVGTGTRACSRCSKELMWRAFGSLWNEEADENRLCLK